ncbi:MAG: hypothetical protein KBG05_04420 [Lachnospiraceae bacterium]|nr:hypothetical protein [Lachnospiraceae bacterium]
MNRVEYMKELEALLADIPADEREDAINSTTIILMRVAQRMRKTPRRWMIMVRLP